MHDDSARVLGRLERFVRERLRPALYDESVSLSVEHWVAPGEPVPFSEASVQRYVPTPAGWRWGAAWRTTWFRLTGEVPAGWEGRDIEIVCDLGFTAERPGFQCEGLAYGPGGVIVKAVSPLSHHIPWDPARRRIELLVEGASNPDVAGEYSYAPTPLGDRETAPADPLYVLGTIAVAARNVAVWELWQDVRMIEGLVHQLAETTPRRQLLVRALERMLDAVDPDAVAATAGDGRRILAPSLASPATASSHTVVAVGHAHIDSAWLWPTRETVRKVARTFANVLELMDGDPDFRFAASSAQQYAWLREFYPELFERVRERVAEGRFIPVGGMWVESDTNMPSGEAIVRQFLLGKRFFQSEFGIDTEEVWLPDSFGYSAAMPQICAGTGNRWFLTQKPSWSEVNPLPHHTFLWEGIDGTRLFTHLPPVDTYISQLTPDELLHAERNFRDGGVARSSLVPFGWGDGGGGPTREMLAMAARGRDLEGLPRVRLGTPREFFEEAEREYPDPPVWSGEMYLEMHRGTYTSQLRTKQGNRRSEALLHEAELWATTAAVRAGEPYPVEALTRSWERVLLLQFHDILPGSSIAWVHRDAETAFAEIREALEEVIARSLLAVAGEGDIELVANARAEHTGGVRPFAVAPDTSAPPVRVAGDTEVGTILDNGVVRAVVDLHGRIVSLRRLADGREAIAPGGAGNRLTVHRDTPNEWDAWDIDEHYRRTATPIDDEAPQTLAVETDDEGAARVVLSRVFGSSTLRQEIRLVPGADAVDVVTRIDWNERQKLLKLSFDLDVQADTSAAETQFGHVRRATHMNTSWEAARFEFCAHRWLHVGEPGYGVAVANDSTYGHDVRVAARRGGGRTTSVALSVIRAPLFPDPMADQGAHTVRVSIRPGADVRDAVAEGHRVNLAERTIRGARAVEPLFDVSSERIVAETIKLADDGSGDVVLRCYEATGTRARATVAVLFDASGWQRTDLLERPSSASWSEGVVELELGPFEIATLRFRRGRG